MTNLRARCAPRSPARPCPPVHVVSAAPTRALGGPSLPSAPSSPQCEHACAVVSARRSAAWPTLAGREPPSAQRGGTRHMQTRCVPKSWNQVEGRSVHVRTSGMCVSRLRRKGSGGTKSGRSMRRRQRARRRIRTMHTRAMHLCASQASLQRGTCGPDQRRRSPRRRSSLLVRLTATVPRAPKSPRARRARLQEGCNLRPPGGSRERTAPAGEGVRAREQGERRERRATRRRAPSPALRSYGRAAARDRDGGGPLALKAQHEHGSPRKASFLVNPFWKRLGIPFWNTRIGCVMRDDHAS